MKVGLVNPNRYLSPPTIPVGLEYLVKSLRTAGHEPRICDLTFSRDPYQDLSIFLDDFRPEALGFTVRNIDTADFERNQFLLEEIREIIAWAKRETGLRVIA